MEVTIAEERGEASWAEVFDNSNARMGHRVFIGCSLQSIQQLSGINAIMFYAPRILEGFFGATGSLYGALALYAVNFFSTVITIMTIERFGRVMILFSGAIVMFIALVLNAILSGINSDSAIGIGVVVFSALYVVGFAYSWGPGMFEVIDVIICSAFSSDYR